MTPAVNLLNKKRVDFTLHRYDHDPQHPSYGLEAAEKLGLDPARVFKTLIVQVDGGELAMAMLPVHRQLNLKSLARALQAKKAVLAEARVVEAATGYILGGVSPLAQKKRLRAVLDESAVGCRTILVSGGRRGLEIEIAPAALLNLLNGQPAPICADQCR